eukprot:1540250-Rhodomonas_salina.3
MDRERRAAGMGGALLRHGGRGMSYAMSGTGLGHVLAFTYVTDSTGLQHVLLSRYGHVAVLTYIGSVRRGAVLTHGVALYQAGDH